MWKKTSIGFRLNCMIGLLLIISCLAIILVNAKLSRDALEHEIRSRTLPALVSEVVAAVDRQLVEPANALSLMAKHPLFLRWMQEGENADQVPGIFQAGHNLAKLYKTGGVNVVSKSTLNFYELSGGQERIKKVNPQSDQWFFAFEESGSSLYVNIHGPTDPDYANMAFLNYRIEDSSKKFLGVLSTGIAVEEFITRISSMKIGEKGATFMVRKSGEVMLHPNRDLIGKSLKELPGFDGEALKALHEQTAMFDTKNADGERIMVISREIPILNAVVFSSASPAELFAGIDKAWIISAAVGLGILIAGFLFSTLFVRSITQPLRQVISYAKDVASGKPSSVLPSGEGGEIGSLLEAVNSMVHSIDQRLDEIERSRQEAQHQTELTKTALASAQTQEQAMNTLVADMQRVSREAETIAEEVASSAAMCAKDLDLTSRKAEANNERFEEITLAMRDMQERVNAMTFSASVAAKSTDTATSQAKQGEKTLQETIHAIDDVNARTDALRESLSSLGDRAESIGRILTVISDIADQTNLLALNAAIEAARAGEAGRGFAVVADEVRKLAEKTVEATQEVDKNIKDIQHATQASIAGMDSTMKSVENATGLTRESGEMLQTIVVLMAESSGKVDDITHEAKAQDATTHRVLGVVEETRTITTQTVSEVEHVSSLVSGLSTQVQNLRALVVELAHHKQ